MENYPAGASNDPRAPFNEQETVVETLTIEEIRSQFKEKVEFLNETDPLEIYWDYRDELSDELIAKLLEEDGIENVHSEIWDLNIDSNYDLEISRCKEILREIQDAELYDDFDDVAREMRDEFLDCLNVDLNLDDLLRNTPNPIFHYDTGYEMDSDSWNWSEKRVMKEVRDIKRFLGVKTDEYDRRFIDMVQCATYGGNLLIYFRLDLNEFMGWDRDINKAIVFEDYWCGIVNSSNGSGFTMEESLPKFRCAFHIENLILEKSVHYNWTYDIAGMCRDWCDSTEVRLEKRKGKAIRTSAIPDHIKLQKEYDRVYKAGGCTFGDMDITRHRNTPYSNNYPCGSTCTKCGTFWID